MPIVNSTVFNIYLLASTIILGAASIMMSSTGKYYIRRTDSLNCKVASPSIACKDDKKLSTAINVSAFLVIVAIFLAYMHYKNI